MKAAQINEYGDATVIHINDIPRPTANEKQVVVEVHAASINPFDAKLRSGFMQQYIPLHFPATLGGDIAGIVAETGSEVTDFAVGDKVYGQAAIVAGNSGAFAEFAATSANEISKAPANLSFEEIGSLPLAGVSALQALTQHINLRSGQKILIHGGSGGIGSIAIQIAKHLGAHVATTASSEATDFVKELGADEVINYKTQDFTKLITNCDAVFDTVGGETFEKSFAILRPKGIAVSMVGPANEEVAKEYNVTAIAQGTKVTTEALNQLTELINAGVVTPHIAKIFPIDQIQEAFQKYESGGNPGKIVLKIQ